MKTFTIFSGDKLITTTATNEETMSLIWDDELNTEEHPIRVFDNETGNEIEW